MIPDELREDHQTANCIAFLKAHDRGGHSPFLDDVTGWAWSFYDESNEIRTINHNLEPLLGRAHSALPLMTIEIIKLIAVNSHIHIVTDQNYFNDMINSDKKIRISSKYRKTNGVSLANEDLWRKLDEASAQFGTCLSAGRPKSDAAVRRLCEVSRLASRAARNVGARLGDWDL